MYIIFLDFMCLVEKCLCFLLVRLYFVSFGVFGRVKEYCDWIVFKGGIYILVVVYKI